MAQRLAIMVVVAALAAVAVPRAWTQGSPMPPLPPIHPEYVDLQQARERYLAIAREGGWPSLPDDIFLEHDPGAVRDVGASADPFRAAILHALCQRLVLTGDYEPVPESWLPGDAGDQPCGAYLDAGATYDLPLVTAVRRFQTRHGLVIDGIVGPNTLEALNEPVEERIRRITVNMHRWRGMPDMPDTRHIRVNIAGFRLVAFEAREPALAMRVVVGKPTTPTPLMRDTISYLVFRPYWNVPASITVNELLPRIAEDPSYLRRRGLQVVDGFGSSARVLDPVSVDWGSARQDFPYRLRQTPGRHNSLGLLKFMFPNDYHVYLHDTPAKHRFAARRRAFSHGCVRVADPVGLAAFLLQDESNWSRARIRRAMQASDRRVVSLDTPVPVFLNYFTAWVEGGQMHFRRDLYGLDDRDGFDSDSMGVAGATSVGVEEKISQEIA